MNKVLIPARSGSRGLIGKNMRILCGSPLIEYAIKEALEVFLPKDIYLSSDGKDIIEFGSNFGINLIRRPNKLSNDNSTSTDVINHFIECQETKKNFSIIYLQPTSPLRNSEHIRASLDLFNQLNAGSVISVCLSKESPYKAYKLNKKNLLEDFITTKDKKELRQLLPPTYYPNGAIYIFKRDDFIFEGKIPTTSVSPFIMKTEESVDIDDELDLKLAEIIMGTKNAI